jgi:hypothetical protein
VPRPRLVERVNAGLHRKLTRGMTSASTDIFFIVTCSDYLCRGVLQEY